jgi:hypothetical protein
MLPSWGCQETRRRQWRLLRFTRGWHFTGKRAFKAKRRGAPSAPSSRAFTNSSFARTSERNRRAFAATGIGRCRQSCAVLPHSVPPLICPTLSESAPGRRSPPDPLQAVGKWLKRHMHLVFSPASIDFRAGSSRLDALGGVADCCNGVGRDVSVIAVDCHGFV